MSPAAVAGELGCQVWVARLLIERNILRGFREVDGTIRVFRRDVEALMRAHAPRAAA
jgi:hypothetical protein